MYREGIAGEEGVVAQWRFAEVPYGDRELFLWTAKDLVEYKEWWDPGHDPNRFTYDIATWKRALDGDGNAEILAQVESFPREMREEMKAVVDELS